MKSRVGNSITTFYECRTWGSLVADVLGPLFMFLEMRVPFVVGCVGTITVSACGRTIDVGIARPKAAGGEVGPCAFYTARGLIAIFGAMSEFLAILH